MTSEKMTSEKMTSEKMTSEELATRKLATEQYYIEEGKKAVEKMYAEEQKAPYGCRETPFIYKGTKSRRLSNVKTTLTTRFSP